MRKLGWRRDDADAAMATSTRLLEQAEEIADRINDPAARVTALVQVSDGHLKRAATLLMPR